MTDNELRALRDANRQDELLCHQVNQIIRRRRNMARTGNADIRAQLLLYEATDIKWVERWKSEH
jgi:hypothetical protein